jgi:hypothetical protein
LPVFAFLKIPVALSYAHDLSDKNFFWEILNFLPLNYVVISKSPRAQEQTFPKAISPLGGLPFCGVFFEVRIMSGLKAWMKLGFGKPETKVFDEDCSPEGMSRYALRMYRLQQLKHLDERFTEVEETEQPATQPMKFESAKGHWFECSSGRKAPGEHEGKQYKITSDTWNRLSASLKTIEERYQEEQQRKTES